MRQFSKFNPPYLLLQGIPTATSKDHGLYMYIGYMIVVSACQVTFVCQRPPKNNSKASKCV